MTEITKGEFMGKCNRTVCSNTQARFYNKSTKKYYCASCADMINQHNRADSLRLFHTPNLCELVKEAV